MLKLIALNYTVLLNGYIQWLNIKKRKKIPRDISIGSRITPSVIKKMPLNKYKKYTVFMLFLHSFEE